MQGLSRRLDLRLLTPVCRIVLDYETDHRHVRILEDSSELTRSRRSCAGTR
jgi:hypothetical protein